MDKRKTLIYMAVSGALVGLLALLLALLGNPSGMGLCIACFIRDIAGSLHMHSASAVQYMRPEIMGLVLGSFIISLIRGEFRPRGGSSPVLRFVTGFFVMVGALVFLGCPLRMVQRLSMGDLNALVGLFGFICGTAAGCLFLNLGFSFGRAYSQSRTEGLVLPSVSIVLLVLLMAFPSVLAFSSSGPGSFHAPVMISLCLALVIGIAAQRSRLCFVGGIRDVILLHDPTLLVGFICVFAVLLVGNLITGNFSLSFCNQPVSHPMHIWNFLGMALVGLGSVMLGGCPMRQLILAGEGNSDSAVAVLGMFVGACAAHNMNLASAPDKGPGPAGKVMVVAGIVILAAVAVMMIYSRRKADD